MSGMLDGRTALVTGGTQGIGLGIVTVLLRQGARVLATGLTEQECEQARAATTFAGEAVAFVTTDVTSRAECDAAVAATLERFGALDVVCANAGVYPQKRLEELTEADLDAIVAVNLEGTIFTVQAARDALIASGRGRVVLTSSITGYPGWSHYGATKAAQLGFMRTAAMELAPHGVTVNAVLPGNVVSAGLRALGQEYLDRMAAAVPLGVLGDPEDIGHAAAFFASDGARYVTGQALVVDGGQLLPESPEALADLRP